MKSTACCSLVIVISLLACGKRSTAPPSSWEPDRSCSKSDECRPAPSCCPAPCTGNVINVRDVDTMQRRVDAACSPKTKEECPQAGSCITHAYLCVRGTCALVTEGDPDWPSQPDAEAPSGTDAATDAVSDAATKPSPDPVWDASCAKDNECVPLQTGCCSTPCSPVVINRRDLTRARGIVEERCRGVDPKCGSAGACRGHAYLCVRKKCSLVFDGDPDFRARRP